MQLGLEDDARILLLSRYSVKFGPIQNPLSPFKNPLSHIFIHWYKLYKLVTFAKPSHVICFLYVGVAKEWTLQRTNQSQSTGGWREGPRTASQRARRGTNNTADADSGQRSRCCHTVRAVRNQRGACEHCEHVPAWILGSSEKITLSQSLLSVGSRTFKGQAWKNETLMWM